MDNATQDNLERLFEDTSLNWDAESSFLEWQLVV